MPKNLKFLISINYYNYQTIKYDFKSIEEEIEKHLLSGKRLFSEKQRFINYLSDKDNNNSSFIQNYIHKYHQNPLSYKEKNLLFEYININSINLIEFYQSLQSLIFYLKNENFINNCSINNIIENIPNFLKIINDDCKKFFKTYQNFKLDKLISILEYFELLCYPYIKENIDEEYKKEINEEQIDKINNYFENNEERLINKNLLSTILRRYISRYLYMKKDKNDTNEKLINFLEGKEELLGTEISNNYSDYIEEFKKMDESFIINVNQSLKFYDFLVFGTTEDKSENSEKN